MGTISINGKNIKNITINGKIIHKLNVGGKVLNLKPPVTPHVLIPVNNFSYATTSITINVPQGAHNQYVTDKELWFEIKAFIDDVSYAGSLTFTVVEWLYGTKYVSGFTLQDLRDANPTIAANKEVKGYLSMKWNGSSFNEVKYLPPDSPK